MTGSLSVVLSLRLSLCLSILDRSRFLSSAETNYVAIEGEALAVAWGLEQTRYFTMGCPTLSVVTDHKPLVKILGSKPPEDVTNPRLFRLKQRVAMWKFDIAHLPGRSNWAADATSRKPTGEVDEEEVVESSIAAFSCAALAISWNDVVDAAARDDDYQRLVEAVLSSFPPWSRSDEATAQFHERQGEKHRILAWVVGGH